MKNFHPVFIVSLLINSVSNAFFTNTVKQRQSYLSISQLPTLEELSTDPFMKQLQHGSDLTNALGGNSNDLSSQDLKELIQAQLSHSDGIRGFMAVYLTTENDQDTFKVPDVLVQALQEQAQLNPDKLIPLAFMNVIMPTAMSTMHQEKELQQSSSRTAKRGLCVLEALVGQHDSVNENAKAILGVASDQSEEESDSSPAMIKFWTAFFKQWGYEETQKLDISEVMTSFLQSK